MDEKVEALHLLEEAFRYWYWATDHDQPDVGILVISLSMEGCDLQYFGKAPNQVVDWPELFSRILEQLRAGGFTVESESGVSFER